MTAPDYEGFLVRQAEAALELEAATDGRVQIGPLPRRGAVDVRAAVNRHRAHGGRLSDVLPPLPATAGAPAAARYVVWLGIAGWVREDGGPVRRHEGFHVGLHFPPDYQATVRPYEIVMLLAPRAVWHPNVLGPIVCLGKVRPAYPFKSVVLATAELLSWLQFNPNDVLNAEAARWANARENRRRIPVDTRPLIARRGERRAAVSPAEGAAPA